MISASISLGRSRSEGAMVKAVGGIVSRRVLRGIWQIKLEPDVRSTSSIGPRLLLRLTWIYRSTVTVAMFCVVHRTYGLSTAISMCGLLKNNP
jgi:hypothetical protein